MYKKVAIALFGALVAFCTAPVLAADDSEPTVSQVYDAARAGHLDQAHQMMTQVLANHPHSARAHYVAAQLDADMKNMGEARQELKTAEEIDPGLPFANPQVVAALRAQIGLPQAPAQSAAAAQGAAAVRGTASKPFPWTIVWVVGAGLFLLWLLLRRRQAPVYAAGAPGAMNPPAGGFPNVVAGGSGIMGGLASGLAVGAGIAAGEELVRHTFDSNHGVGGNAPVAPDPVQGPANSDLGGPDFGISDPGSSWDDGGGSSSGDDGGGWT
jgi:hypothetical protein